MMAPERAGPRRMPQYRLRRRACPTRCMRSSHGQVGRLRAELEAKIENVTNLEAERERLLA